MSPEPRLLDVSELPDAGYGTRSNPWWGTVAFMAAEGATLVLCAATWLYLARRQEAWPPPGIPAPDLLVPTLTMAVLLVSLVPARLLDRAGKRQDRSAVVRLLAAGVVLEVAALALRGFEFGSLNVRWDTHAYGSIVWFTVGIHTTLLAADLAETATFLAIFLFGRVEEKHYPDVCDVAVYWRFIVLAWLPLYLLLYVSHRLF